MVWVIAKCFKYQTDLGDYEFRYNGYFRGQKITKICVNTSQRGQLCLGKVYLFSLENYLISNHNMIGKVDHFREL